jgi:TetR/AcrR family transcriptional repressor of nem operon
MEAAQSEMRDRILDVALDLIQRRGLNGMSYQDISAAVGIRKASIHHHFPGKGDLLHALLLRHRADFNRTVGQVAAAPVAAPLKLRRYFALFVDTLREGSQDKICLCGMLAGELLSLDKKNVEQVRAFLQENAHQLKAILAQGIREETLRVPGDLESTSHMVLSTLEGALLLARCDGGPKRMEAVLTQLRKLLEA